MNPPVPPTSLGLVGHWQLLVAFLLRLACRPCGLSGRTPVDIPARAPLARSPTITRPITADHSLPDSALGGAPPEPPSVSTTRPRASSPSRSTLDGTPVVGRRI
jgi:hypothetical protein